MNRTQIVDSDDEADESMLIPKKAAKGGQANKIVSNVIKKREIPAAPTIQTV